MPYSAALELTENKVLSHRVVFRRKIVSRCNVQEQVLDTWLHSTRTDKITNTLSHRVVFRRKNVSRCNVQEQVLDTLQLSNTLTKEVPK